ncbi:MFS transporter [Corynebacterium hylobatis]|uniref:MFS transporter n=2 Tax=Corynebacterium TaxID=1716 RepID=A0A430I2S1_9CORY|nr:MULTISPECIES: sugar porter family MFS transporter [Corynebacterium]MCS5479944.1 sugar porter family MFS transporter [Corynebacterium lemuris]RSZ66042.1 MFS transporter [Corynebacterium hylobatis]
MTDTTYTADERVNSRLIGVVATAALGGFLFGFDSSIINGTVEAIREQFSLNTAVLGFVVSVALLGAGVGAWTAGICADRIGRVKTMVIAATILFVSSVGAGLAFGVIDLIIWRFLGGVGIGFASVIAPGYIAEVSPAKHRGTLATMQQLALVTGIFMALLTSAVLAWVAGSASSELWLGLPAWRWMLISAALPSLVYGVLAVRLPESPRFLTSRGRTAEARQVLREVVGMRTEASIDRAIDSMLSTVKLESRQKFSDLLGGRFGLLPLVWIGILLSVFQQFVGINVIFYYSTTLWQAVGFQESDSFIISVITAVTNIVATIIAILLIDRVGRRRLLLIGSAIMTVSLGTMALAFAQANVIDGAPVLPGSWGPIALVAANLFVIGFGMSWGPTVWVLLGEMFPNHIRAYALGVGGAAQWLANFVVSATFPSLADAGLQLAYGLYGFFALASFVFVFFLVPETNGKQLEAMGEDSPEEPAPQIKKPVIPSEVSSPQTSVPDPV